MGQSITENSVSIKRQPLRGRPRHTKVLSVDNAFQLKDSPYGASLPRRGFLITKTNYPLKKSFHRDFPSHHDTII